jgi:hypothetical protein
MSASGWRFRPWEDESKFPIAMALSPTGVATVSSLLNLLLALFPARSTGNGLAATAAEFNRRSAHNFLEPLLSFESVLSGHVKNCSRYRFAFALVHRSWLRFLLLYRCRVRVRLANSVLMSVGSSAVAPSSAGCSSTTIEVKL